MDDDAVYKEKQVFVSVKKENIFVSSSLNVFRTFYNGVLN